ncbi:HlyD family secretion protein [Hollandina sp. SP2]
MPDYGKNDGSNEIAFNYIVETKRDKMYSFFVVLLFLIIITITIFISVGKIDIVIKSECTIRPNDTISNIRNTTSGFISNKQVVHGDYVKAGDILFTIYSNDLLIEKENCLFILQINKKKLEELTMYDHAINAKTNTIQKEYLSIYTRVQKYFFEEYKLQLAIQRAEDKLNQEKSKSPYVQIPVIINECELDLQIAVNELLSFRANELIQIHNEKINITLDIEAQKSRINYLTEQIRKCEIKASISGIYEELMPFNVNDYLLSGSEIARIIPDNNNEFKVEILIDTHNIAEIKHDLPFYIRFDSISPFEFGQIEGRLTNIGADLITINTANTMNSVFIAYGTIEKTWVENRAGYKVNLRTGMTGQCRIIIKTQTIFSYFLEKIGFI